MFSRQRLIAYGKKLENSALAWAVLSFASGMLYAAALPPLNWSGCALLTLIVPLCAIRKFRWRFAVLCCWLWGIGWSLFAYMFLREIVFIVPVLLAPVISLWPAVWGGIVHVLWHKGIFPESEKSKNPLPRLLLFALLAAALFTLIEWTRSRLFVWNDFSVTQWRNHAVIQIASVTGSYGIGFLVALTNTMLFAAFSLKVKKALLPLLLTALIWTGVILYGVNRQLPLDREFKVLRAGLVQPDLSQRRHATVEEAYEAIDKCVALSRKTAALEPDILIWPESAAPVTLRGTGRLSGYYRMELAKLLRDTRLPLLIGAIDFADISDSADPQSIRMTNSAIFFKADGRMAGKYDKIHRVPYGEYIPMRFLLPQWLINCIDMGRDLYPGNNDTPFELFPGIHASTAVCYEGVFGYLTRRFALHDANLLVVISNDAWYPRSSEPEQHLANAVIRCVETGLPMIRCGNNGGSGVVTETGRFTSYIGSKVPGKRAELLREMAYGVTEVKIHRNTRRTFYVRYGEWFILLLGVLTAVAGAILAYKAFKRRGKSAAETLQ